ncbi:MAG: hypothetical protein CBC38_02275 [Gammaproteobacteria bacterium TMED78]|nr:MAG: hypothetical protein CBC38_02275 [Gammaproteobacteria bacterium TMED78]|tara:strand:- start:1657 stop:2250 length:594 start_codon:yes stop_codon:yes gene_type:complete
MIFSQASDFMISAKTSKQFPQDSGLEVAFVGRSNSGKSSAINAILHRKNLAKTSKTPGRTQLINFFSVSDSNHRIVDLPGYGFAKVSIEIRDSWTKMIESYLFSRNSLAGFFITIDARRGLNDLDRTMIIWADSANKPIVILLTKIDKISKNTHKNLKNNFDKTLPIACNSLLFSSTSGEGIEESQLQLSNWLSLKD